MKKFTAVLLILCLALLCLTGCGEEAAETPEESAPVENTEGGDVRPEAMPEIPEVKMPDLDAVYASHEPREVVAVIDGEEIYWEDYFYSVFSQVAQLHDYFNSAAMYYGAAMKWSDLTEEGGTETFADSAVNAAEQNLMQLAAIRGFAKENGVELGEEQLKAIEEQHAADIVALCGEGATEADFEAYLKNIYMSVDMYDEMNRMNHIFQQNFIQVYGEEGEKMDDERAMKFLTDGNYIYANHILLATVDMATGAPLSEEEIKAKEEKAAEIAAELHEISEPEELLERFAELKKEFCEDSGKQYFMDGMVFSTGEMVPEFEQASYELEEYQVSEPVKTDFGYHIIIRLPLDPDAVLEYTQMGTPVSVRGACANIEYTTRLQQYLEGLSIEYAEGFEKPNLLDYLDEE